MVIKSLTITEDAYNALKRMKHEDESFSEVILRISAQKADHVRKYFGILKTGRSAEEWYADVKKRRAVIDAESKDRQKRWSAL